MHMHKAVEEKSVKVGKRIIVLHVKKEKQIRNNLKIN